MIPLFQTIRLVEPYLILRSLYNPILLSIGEVNRLSHPLYWVPIIVWFQIITTFVKDLSNAKVVISINIGQCMTKVIKIVWMQGTCIHLKIKDSQAIAPRMILQLLGSVVQVSINKKLQNSLKIKQIWFKSKDWSPMEILLFSMKVAKEQRPRLAINYLQICPITQLCLQLKQK